MKNFKFAAALLSAAIMWGMSSCKEDKKYDPVQDPSLKVEAPLVSVAEGEEVAAGDVTIVLTYAKPVALNSLVSITLNDEAVSATVKDENRCIVEVPVTLSAGQSYTLFVPERAVAVIGSPWFAPEVTVNFKAAALETDYAPLTNANATAQAANVYNYLLENNGKKVLSGASAGDGNNNKFADWVGNVAGAYPALACYDFLHLHRSGENWIDYTDISAATSQWQANGLVSYMWHWNVPTDKDALDNKDWNKWGFYCDQTEFDIIEALKEGTWQHDFILSDIDKVAAILTQLQNAGVPVIWRPLHEACGSFKYNNPWFWWGRGGVEATAELWKLMHDRLVNHHGLNNLIWVWTAQYDKGFEAEMATAYPGDEYVDIVGVDLYRDLDNGEDEAVYAARVSDAYNAALAMTAGKKMVALSECGYLLDLSSSVALNGWSWFMLWNSNIDSNPSEDGFGNSTEWIKTVFEGSNVVNRGDMPSLK